MTKEQQEIIANIQREFDNDPRMYEALRLTAQSKWPDDDWGPSFLEVHNDRHRS